MEIVIKGEPKEIAALVLEGQGRFDETKDDRNWSRSHEIQIDENTKVFSISNPKGRPAYDVILKRKNKRARYRKVLVIHHDEEPCSQISQDNGG